MQVIIADWYYASKKILKSLAGAQPAELERAELKTICARMNLTIARFAFNCVR